MPELPEVEILVRHLAPRLSGRRIRSVAIGKPRITRPERPAAFARAMAGATILGVRRRAKFLLFDVQGQDGPALLIGHLGMTGRMFVQDASVPLSRHAAAVFDLGDARWVFEDVRGFGRLTRDPQVLERLGPEPWDEAFSVAAFGEALRGSRQAIKVRLLDQSLVAGVGNIYASEALYRAGLSPRRRAGRLSAAEIGRLRDAIREVLDHAIGVGSTLRLEFADRPGSDGLFYFGRAADAPAYDTERLWVYDRAGQACARCGSLIRRLVQGGRSTFFCPTCQR